MNTPPRKVVRNNVQKDFFKLINISVFGKTIENAQKHRGIKLVKNKKRKKPLGVTISKLSTKNLLGYGSKYTFLFGIVNATSE